MAQKTLLTIDGTHHNIKKPLLTIGGTHRKVKKAFLTKDGVWKQVYPSYTWQRFTVEDATKYYWDKYSVTSKQEPTGGVNVRSSSGTKTVDWGDTIYFPKDDPPEIDAAYNDYSNNAYWVCGSGNWNGVDEGGEWVVEDIDADYDCYYVTSVEDASGSSVKITYTKIASAATKTVYYKGATSYGQVSAVDDNDAYPANGKSGSYWYVYNTSESIKVKGSLVDTVYGDTPDDYPENGIHTDGYWYVKVEI